MATQSEPAPEWERLYHEAFDQFHAFALWYLRELDNPCPQHALNVARSLRFNGDMDARRLAERIEQACHAAD